MTYHKVWYRGYGLDPVDFEIPLLENMTIYTYKTWDTKDGEFGTYLIPIKITDEMSDFLKEFDMFRFTSVQKYSKDDALLVIREVSFVDCKDEVNIIENFKGFPYIELYKTSYDPEDMIMFRSTRIIGPSENQRDFVMTWIDLEEQLDDRLRMFRVENDILEGFRWNTNYLHPGTDVWNQEYNKKVFHTLLSQHMSQYMLNLDCVDESLNLNRFHDERKTISDIRKEFEN